MSKLDPNNFKHLKLGAEAFIWDLKPLFRITHLSSLDIQQSPSLATSAFIRAVENLPHLTNIRLSRSMIRLNDAIPAIVEHLPKLSQLTIVHAENDVTNADVFHVTKLTNLENLSLEAYALTLDDKIVRAIATSLTKLHTLTLSSTSASAALADLSQLTMLTKLVIPLGYFLPTAASLLPAGMRHIDAAFSDDSVESLVSQCAGLTRLEVAPYLPSKDDTNASTSKLTDKSLMSIAKVAELRSLTLKYDVTYNGLMALQHVSTLEHLNLSTLVIN